MREDNRHLSQQDGKVVILAPSKTAMTSYHQSGMSSFDEWKARKEYAKSVLSI